MSEIPAAVIGLVVKDVRGNFWRIGDHIGSGGFGSIYKATADGNSTEVRKDTPLAIKIEPHENGSLFTEMHFYHRCAKVDKMEEWQRQRNMDYVGMPSLHGSGSFYYRKQRYRFIVIDRFGTDLQSIISKNDGKMPLKTALTVAIRVTDILEYIHFHGYLHKDVKAQNLLLGCDDPNRIYLVDFGLACRYIVHEAGYELHKENKEDLRRAHDGTIEFTSRDGHIGAHSRRSDLEVLLYNLIYWMSGKLPWSNNREDADDIACQKNVYMNDPQNLMRACFGSKGAPPFVLQFANYVARLGFAAKPNYELCREIFKQAILKTGYKNDMHLIFEGGVIRIQNKRQCRKSYMAKKIERTDSQNSKASVESCSSEASSVATRRTRRRCTQDENGSACGSDRPSVKRSCFDSRQSSGRRTGSTRSVCSGIVNGNHNSPPFTNLINGSANSYQENRVINGLENPTPAMLLVMDRLKIKNATNGSLNGYLNPLRELPLSFKDRILDSGSYTIEYYPSGTDVQTSRETIIKTECEEDEDDIATLIICDADPSDEQATTAEESNLHRSLTPTVAYGSDPIRISPILDATLGSDGIYRCNLCDYTTRLKQALRYHMYKHQPNVKKPFQCPYCSFSAYMRSHLQNHILIHTGERPQACPLCPYRGREKTALRRHLKSRHGIPMANQDAYFSN